MRCSDHWLCSHLTDPPRCVFTLPATMFAGTLVAPHTVADDDMAEMYALYVNSDDSRSAARLAVAIRDQLVLAGPLYPDAQRGRLEQLQRAFGFAPAKE